MSEPNPHPAAPKSGRFKTFVAWVCGPIVLLELIALAVVAVWAVQFRSKTNSSEPAYVSTARLLVGGTDVGAQIPDEFFGTNIELIQSAEVLKRAGLRVKALHSEIEMQPQPCKVEAGRIPGTRIIFVRGAAAESKYAQAYVDAVVDEFIAVRREMKSDATLRASIVIQDWLVRLEKDMVMERDEMREFSTKRDHLPEAERATMDMVEDWKRITEKFERTKTVYDDLMRKLRKLDVDKNMNADVITLLERASRDSASPGIVVGPPPSIFDRYIKPFINLFK